MISHKKNLPLGIIFLIISFFIGSCNSVTKRKNKEKPNILLIIADDLNDKVGGYGEDIQAKTPYMDQLRQHAFTFINAQTNVPLCNPSRASLLSGLYPHTTGFYGFNQHENQWRNFPILESSVTLFEHFHNNGYKVFGTGKVFHNKNSEEFEKFHPDAFGVNPSFGPYAFNGSKTAPHPSLPVPYGLNYSLRSFGPLSDVPSIKENVEEGIDGYTGWWDRGKPFNYIDENDRDLLTDEKSAAWAAEILSQQHEKPFLLSVGFVRPHRPLVAPKEYFDLYPLGEIRIPSNKSNDLTDVPEVLWKNLNDPEKAKGFVDFSDLMDSYSDTVEGWKLWTQAYLACVSYVDAQIGKVLKALETSDYSNNTIVIVTSDHGYHMGEKNYMFKLSVWEESNRIPLIIRVPDMKNQPATISQPVSLIDLYPTLIDLADLPSDPNQGKNDVKLDGHSLKSLMKQPDGSIWTGPSAALSVIYGSDQMIDQLESNEPGKTERQHFTIRSQEYRYTLTNNGYEELYYHVADPNEWNNLVDDSDYQEIKSKLKDELLTMIQ